jgi:hypothetical protein
MAADVEHCLGTIHTRSATVTGPPLTTAPR